MPDLGELDLQATRARQKRTPASLARPGVGASRVGPRTEPVTLPPPEQPNQPTPVSPSTPKSADADNALAPSTISLDRRTEELLEAVRTAGRFAQPKVDANRSATIRFAMAILAEQFSPEQIVAELRSRAPAATGTGRRRLS